MRSRRGSRVGELVLLASCASVLVLGCGESKHEGEGSPTESGGDGGAGTKNSGGDGNAGAAGSAGSGGRSEANAGSAGMAGKNSGSAAMAGSNGEGASGSEPFIQPSVETLTPEREVPEIPATPAPVASTPCGWTGPDHVTSVTFSPDGRFVVTGQDYGARVWDATNGAPVHVFRPDDRMGREPLFSRDGSRLAVNFEHDTTVFAADDWHPVQTLSDPFNPNGPVALSPDGEQIVKGKSDGSIEIFTVADLSSLHEIEAHENEVMALAISADGTLLASVAYDAVRLWSFPSGELVREYETGYAPGGTALFTNDGEYLFIGGLYRVDPLEPMLPVDSVPEPVAREVVGSVALLIGSTEYATQPLGTPPPAGSFAFATQDETRRVVGGVGALRVEDLTTGSVLWQTNSSTLSPDDGSGAYRALATATSNGVVVALPSDGEIRLLSPDGRTEQRRNTTSLDTSYLMSAWTSDDASTIVVSGSMTVAAWDLVNDAPLTAGNVSVAPDGLTRDGSLLFGVIQGHARTWTTSGVEAQADFRILPDSGYTYTSLLLHDNDTFLASEVGLTVASLASRTITKRVGGPILDSIVSLAESPDGEFIAACTQSGWLELFSDGDFRMTARVRAHDDRCQVSFTPSGRVLTYGGGVMRVWSAGAASLELALDLGQKPSVFGLGGVTTDANGTEVAVVNHYTGPYLWCLR
jgi:WD40 repeat protein